MLLGKDKLAAFRDSDIFTLPSYSENFGLAVIEAMASGMPVIISNKVGIFREVQSYNAGVVIDCNEISLYQAMKSILDNANFAEELSSKARRMAEEYYDIDKVAGRMIEAYREILRRG
jgi:glycosyltransferase involved in cell wall biosynthesis